MSVGAGMKGEVGITSSGVAVTPTKSGAAVRHTLRWSGPERACPSLPGDETVNEQSSIDSIDGTEGVKLVQPVLTTDDGRQVLSALPLDADDF